MKGTLWGGDSPLDPDLDAYTVGKDRELDARLLPWDILGTMAHAAGLVEIGILSREEGRSLHRALAEALREAEEGSFAPGPEDEDVHSALEKYLVAKLGTLGRKVHAGRSRNDQVLVDLRLFLKDALFRVMEALGGTVRALERFGKSHAGVVLPGYTHQRRAMPSSVGLWAAGFAEALLEDLFPLEAALDAADRSPLGSAAGYGVPLPLPREKTARL
ncbi:MAG TPA: argininosuccinate lyase, partial [Planctomycetes bacterium]|nr:argininosuccinate lyase [Planctomycetota bacterium]